MVTLYRSERYPVVIGNGKHVALCTCWSSPDILLKTHPELREHYALIGTLYGREGISVILRNLLLNPQITHIHILANNPLSQTIFGVKGWHGLLDLWKHGLTDDHRIKNTEASIHKELPPAVVRSLMSRITIRDVSGVAVNQLSALVTAIPVTAVSIQPQSFPEPTLANDASFPSEGIGWSVHAPSLLEAWTLVVDRILRYGSIKSTQYGNKQRELQGITWVFDAASTRAASFPEWPEHVQEMIGLRKQALEEYALILMDPHKPPGTYYTYGARIRNYFGTDQLEALITELRQAPHTRRAAATLSYPPEDAGHESPPCLAYLHFLVSDGALNLFATFRSHDIGKAAIANAYALLGLLEHVAAQTNVKPGKVAITSNSAHIYEEEWRELRLFIACERWSEPRKQFSIESRIDPRGNVRILADAESITVELVDTQGTVYDKRLGSSARTLMMEITALNLLHDPYHYADIAIELTKAELARASSQQYFQDKPLVIGGHTIR